MRATSLEILAITALIVNYVARDVKTQIATETLVENSTYVTNGTSSPKNATKKTRMDYWMRRMGPIQDDLINVQAIVAKAEDLTGTCKPAPRKSNRRYLMCGGSILNRNHVITSATCVHEATHIRHNVHAPLAVAIAPLQKSMQVIPVVEYFIHPDHRTNPYSPSHMKHNIAVIKLSCRIDLENYHKIELPTLPMRQTCSEENCVVAVFRRTGRTTHVMSQMLAPDILDIYRRRKETSFQDEEFYTPKKKGGSAIIDGSIRLERRKRKLAQAPSFMGKYETRKMFDDEPMDFATETPTENSTARETTTLRIEDEDMSSTIETSLHEEVSKALSEPEVAVEPVKSFVVRSSQWYIPCAHTGAPVLLNRTQAALVAIPCNGRQRDSKWYYTDLYDNLEWLRPFVHEKPPELPTPEIPSRPGNGTGCSTCIFNFFIQIGCKEKGTCAKNVTTHPGGNPPPNLPGQAPPNFPRPVPPNRPGEIPPNRPGEIPHNLPGEFPPDRPGEIPPNRPGEMPPNLPGEFTPNRPGEMPPNLPGEFTPNRPGEISPNRPGEFPPNRPGEFPPNRPGEIYPNRPGEFPPNRPGEIPPNRPGEMPPNLPGEFPPNRPGEVPPDSSGGIPPADGLPMASGRRTMQGGCTRNSVGIEIGQGCDKTEKKSSIRPIYHAKSGKVISGSEKIKHLSQANSAVGYVPQLQQPVAGRTFKIPYRNYFVDKGKYAGKDNNRISSMSQNYKKPMGRNFHRERATNEIGRQNGEADWIYEVRKKLELSSEVKPQLANSRRSNSN